MHVLLPVKIEMQFLAMLSLRIKVLFIVTTAQLDSNMGLCLHCCVGVPWSLPFKLKFAVDCMPKLIH